MKQSDFDRLKAVCEKEGFDLVHGTNNYMLLVKKKDIWEGVEFVELIDAPESLKGKIYKGYVKDGVLSYFIDGKFNKTGFKEAFRPSTETAYVEQLKAEAFKRFGEIKIGDSFLQPWYGKPITILSQRENESFSYESFQDTLFFNRWAIYHSGKWATRISERVKVEWITYMPTRMTFQISKPKILSHEEMDEIGKMIEELLNRH